MYVIPGIPLVLAWKDGAGLAIIVVMGSSAPDAEQRKLCHDRCMIIESSINERRSAQGAAKQRQLGPRWWVSVIIDHRFYGVCTVRPESVRRAVCSIASESGARVVHITHFWPRIPPVRASWMTRTYGPAAYSCLCASVRHFGSTGTLQAQCARALQSLGYSA